MTGRNLSQISVPVALLVTELFQGFFTELTKISNLHGSTQYNIFTYMSRKINKNFRWGKILKKFRKEGHLNQTEIGEAIGYKGDAKGNVSEIEQGKLPIDEEKVRLWIEKCGRNIFEFYVLAAHHDGGSLLLDQLKSSNKSTT